MKQSLATVSLLVRDYDEALEFYLKKLNFNLVEDTYLPDEDKRWVTITPQNSNGAQLLLAKAEGPVQERAIGNQAGGRVFLFLSTDDFWRDYELMTKSEVEFVREPITQEYGTVAVFKDLYGNLWDLIEHTK